MERLDDKPIPRGSGEIRCFCVGRNEAVKIPQFLEHHRGLGVDRFFYVDNGSDDVYILDCGKVIYVWRGSSATSFEKSNRSFGVLGY